MLERADLVEVRQKVQEILVVLWPVWRFLEGAFGKISLLISERSDRFQLGKFYAIFEHVCC